MKTSVIVCAVLLASCAARRAEKPDIAPDLVDEPSDEPHVAGIASGTCSPEQQCALDVVEMARRRVERETENEAKISEGNQNAHTKKVAQSWMETLARSIADERGRFSQWCELAQDWSAAKRKSGAPGLTTDDVRKLTGEPTQERTPESRDDGGVEAKVWTWEVSGPLSRSISFGIMFMRPAGTNDSMVYSGCQWCAEGGPATSSGCVMLPEKK